MGGVLRSIEKLLEDFVNPINSVFKGEKRHHILLENVNHLGNINGCFGFRRKPNYNHDSRHERSESSGVCVVINDKKTPTCVAGNPVTWTAEIMEANDYYPFGQVMPSRTYALTGAKKTRYGYNDKEKDNEVVGDGVTYDYGFRIYDARLGRFLSVDPLFKDYPWNSVYAFAENDVIRCIDLDGLEKVVVVIRRTSNQNNTEYYSEFNANINSLKESGYDVIEASTGQGVLLQLENYCTVNGEITNLVFLNHGTSDGLIGTCVEAGDRFVSTNSGLYTRQGYINTCEALAREKFQKEFGHDVPTLNEMPEYCNSLRDAQNEMRSGGAASLEDLSKKVASGRIKFSTDATVVFGGCNGWAMAQEISNDLKVTAFGANEYTRDTGGLLQSGDHGQGKDPNITRSSRVCDLGWSKYKNGNPQQAIKSKDQNTLNLKQ